MEGGTVTDGIVLDRARARKVPKKMIGRTLNNREVVEAAGKLTD
jgi:hypothetical protein